MKALSQCRLTNFYRAAIRQLREEWDFDEEECEKMGMSFLQKVARSGCYVKSDYAIDRMMEARHWQVQIRYTGYSVHQPSQTKLKLGPNMTPHATYASTA